MQQAERKQAMEQSGRDFYQTKNSRGQRHKRKSRTNKYDEKRNIKTGNTISVLQEDKQEPILEMEQLPQINKIDKAEKKKLKVGEERE